MTPDDDFEALIRQRRNATATSAQDSRKPTPSNRPAREKAVSARMVASAFTKTPSLGIPDHGLELLLELRDNLVVGRVGVGIA